MMRIEYENGVLRMENAEGRRWQLNNAEKPAFSFAYDALAVGSGRAVRRIGAKVQPLGERELEEVKVFMKEQAPPAVAPTQTQLASDLKAFAYGLINTVAARLEYDSLLDVQITGREDSTDLYAAEARRVLAFVDTVWNAYHGLIAQISATPAEELQDLKAYANLMPKIPALEHFTMASALAVAEKPAKSSSPVTIVQNSQADSGPPSAVSLEAPAAESADFTNIINRALVFDNLFSSTHIHLLEQWALKTPHWMLTNSTHDEHGRPLHRIWGASYIQAWQRGGWVGLPPVLFSTVATIFQKLNVTITAPRYIGLNGQSPGQNASIHEDCERDMPNEISILVYIGENVDGDLVLYDKKDQKRQLHKIAFRPNRVIAFDGSVPHQAFAPTCEGFRMSLVIRGQYECRSTDLSASTRISPEGALDVR